MFSKTTGLMKLSSVIKSKEKWENLSRLMGNKWMWQVNATHHPGLDCIQKKRSRKEIIKTTLHYTLYSHILHVFIVQLMTNSGKTGQNIWNLNFKYSVSRKINMTACVWYRKRVLEEWRMETRNQHGKNY
jgi:hypothetical protein